MAINQGKRCTPPARIMSRILWHVGLRSDYRQQFWRMFWILIRRGEVELIFHISIVAHHLIAYTREALQGKGQASNYSLRTVDDKAIVGQARAA